MPPRDIYGRFHASLSDVTQLMRLGWLPVERKRTSVRIEEFEFPGRNFAGKYVVQLVIFVLQNDVTRRNFHVDILIGLA